MIKIIIITANVYFAMLMMMPIIRCGCNEFRKIKAAFEITVIEIINEVKTVMVVVMIVKQMKTSQYGNDNLASFFFQQWGHPT